MIKPQSKPIPKSISVKPPQKLGQPLKYGYAATPLGGWFFVPHKTTKDLYSIRAYHEKATGYKFSQVNAEQDGVAGVLVKRVK